MAKLLVSCDDYVYRYHGKFYAKDQERWDFYERYLRVFDELKLVTRCVNENILVQGRILLENDSRIEYIPLPFFSGPKQYVTNYIKIGEIINHITEGCSAAIMRLPSTVAQRICRRVMKVGIPYAVEVVYDAHDDYKSETNVINRLLWRKIDRDMRKSCAKANGVSCVTESYLQKRYFSDKQNSFTSHYSSLALEKSFYSSARKFPSHQPLKIAHVSNQVCFDGRKGFNELIEAISILKNENIDVCVQFAGGDYHNGIARLRKYAEKKNVADRIRFLGNLNRQQLSDYLENSDLYVMPTKAEGLSRAIIEAMAKGLPCITTPVSGNPELLSPHYLVDYYDVRTLADRIKELVSNKESYEKASSENFNNSLKYKSSILQKRRDEFYSKLKDRCDI